MTSCKLIISPAARNDLQKIYQYGSLNWGNSRATNYLDNLKEQLWSLTKHPKMGIKRDDLIPGVRSLAVDRHVVFYRSQKQQLEVIRVLHGRQDPQLALTPQKPHY